MRWYEARFALVSAVALVLLGGAQACGSDDASGVDDAGADARLVNRDGAPLDDGGPSDSEPESDSRSFADAGFDAGDWSQAGTCNDLIGTAPFVERMLVAQDMPAFTGGSIETGTYVLTSIEELTGLDGGTGGTGDFMESTWVVTVDADAGADAGVFDFQEAVASISDSGVGRGRASYRLDIGPGVLATFDIACPAPPYFSIDFQHTASGTGPGAVFKYTLGLSRVYTMTKQ